MGVGGCHAIGTSIFFQLCFDLIALDVHDVYIVNDHGAEKKAKAPPLIGYAMFWDLNLSPMVYRGMRHTY